MQVLRNNVNVSLFWVLKDLHFALLIFYESMKEFISRIFITVCIFAKIKMYSNYFIYQVVY